MATACVNPSAIAQCEIDAIGGTHSCHRWTSLAVSANQFPSIESDFTLHPTTDLEDTSVGRAYQTTGLAATVRWLHIFQLQVALSCSLASRAWLLQLRMRRAMRDGHSAESQCVMLALRSTVARLKQLQELYSRIVRVSVGLCGIAQFMTKRRYSTMR